MDKIIPIVAKTFGALFIFGFAIHFLGMFKELFSILWEEMDIGLFLILSGLAPCIFGWCFEDIRSLWSNSNFRGNIYNWWNKKKNIESSKQEQLEDKLNTILSKLDDVATKKNVINSQKELTRWIHQKDERASHRLREFISNEIKENNK